MSSIEALFAAVERGPEDVELYRVLADALEQAGDPCAPLAQVQLAPGHDAVVERKLIAARRRAVLGALDVPEVELAFRYGFIDHVRVRAPLAPADMGKSLAAVLASPDARLVRWIAIVPCDYGRMTNPEPWGAYTDTIARVLEPLAAGAAPHTLTTLVLGEAFARDRGFRVFDDPWPGLEDDLSRVLDVFPTITDLTIDLGAVDLTWAPLVSSRLRRFTWLSPCARVSEVAALAQSQLPALEAFALGAGARYLARYADDVGYDGLGGTLAREACVGAEDFAALFAMLDGCPRLRELGLPNCASHLPSVLGELARHPLLARLAALDLSWTDFDAEDNAALAQLVARVPALSVTRQPAIGNPRFRYICTME